MPEEKKTEHEIAENATKLAESLFGLMGPGRQPEPVCNATFPEYDDGSPPRDSRC
jgi:hypothetical protein